MHHNHRLFRSKYHYGYNVRYHLANGSTTGSYSGNSYEHDDADGKSDPDDDHSVLEDAMEQNTFWHKR
ncbi:hypothetical protein ZHAS_00011702 [Anopheles sinensis]|uniref:Uncharacterized protein n=1 Tax=Anopheles sinensis TaxID=74873 RepID=A0A084W0V8_ANOSI|nr:hypothetical protein ZHAS_00011702 [Anopheles sinensis]